jgi:hypothetical protein
MNEIEERSAEGGSQVSKFQSQLSEKLSMKNSEWVDPLDPLQASAIIEDNKFTL